MDKYVKVGSVLLFVVGVVVAVVLWQGPTSFVFAWILNFMLMLGVQVVIQAFDLRLNSSYFDAKPWEGDGKIYRNIGVNGFRKLLVLIGWEKLHKANNPVKRTLEILKNLEYNTRQSELGHLIIFLIVLAVNLYVGINYGFGCSIWLLVLNILLNAYPMGVQRYNRPRLRKIIKRAETCRRTI